jgi:hypothetical protein
LTVCCLFVLVSVLPARAAQLASDTFTRVDSNTLANAETGQKWTPVKLDSGQAWAVRSQGAAFLPSGNHLVRYVRLNSGSTSPTTMRVEADITFSPVSANVGLVVNLGDSDRVFCKTERTPNTSQPNGFMSIGGRFDGGSEKSVLGAAKSTFSPGERLTLGSTYHVVLSRSGNLVTCQIAGTNSLGAPIDETVSYTLQSSQANGLNSRSAGLRIRYVINSGSSNEDDAASRWDNVVVSDAV